jgi:hypothetical protein
MIATSAIVPRDNVLPTLKSEGQTEVEHAALFVWGFWALLAVQAYFYVYHYGSKTP